MAVGRTFAFLLLAFATISFASQPPFNTSFSVIKINENDTNMFKPLVSIPIYLDSSEKMEFHLSEGECPETVAKKFANEHRIDEHQAYFFTKSIEARLAKLKRPPSHRVVVLVAYEDDLYDIIYSTPSSTSLAAFHKTGDDNRLPILWNMVLSVLNHHQSGGIHIVLVSNGFMLSDGTKLVLSQIVKSDENNVNQYESDNGGAAATKVRRCASFELIETSEVIGFGAAVNLALENSDLRLSVLHAQDKMHVTVAVLTSTMFLKPTTSLFLDFKEGGGRGGEKGRHQGKENDDGSVHNIDIGEEDHDDNLNLNGGSEGSDIWLAYHSLSKSINLRHELVLFISPSNGGYSMARGEHNVKIYDDLSESLDSEPKQHSQTSKRKEDLIYEILEKNKEERAHSWLNKGITASSPFPLLMFDAQVWRATSKMETSSGSSSKVGLFDEGYFLQGSCADFIAKAIEKNIFVRIASTFARYLY
jgi:hypothetical protein